MMPTQSQKSNGFANQRGSFGTTAKGNDWIKRLQRMDPTLLTLMVGGLACMVSWGLLARQLSVTHELQDQLAHLSSSSLQSPGVVRRARQQDKIVKGSSLITVADDPLTILPYDLPGYTGWARPVQTMAGDFEIVAQPDLVKVGSNYTIKVRCKHPSGKNGGALFYVRAYGKSLLPGIVQDLKNGDYTITILPFDEGDYTLEVVLTFSLVPSFMDTPLSAKDGGKPSYEGYMLPGFPRTFSAVSNKKVKVVRHTNRNNLPSCTAQQLVETSTTSQLATGRWLVTNRTRYWSETRTLESYDRTTPYDKFEGIDLQSYKNSDNAIGIHMEYFYKDCNIISYDDMVSREKWIEVLDSSRKGKGDKKHQAIHVLYIGDSNTRNQFNFFRDHIGIPVSGGENTKEEKFYKVFDNSHSYSFLDERLKLTYVDMMGHWTETFNSTAAKILQIINDKRHRGDEFSVIFNAGLHEITNRCSHLMTAKRFAAEGSCYDVYRRDVNDLAKVIKSFPASLRIWQNTLAGWPKWGLFGVQWPQDRGQYFPLCPNFCGWINDLAWDIMQKHRIPVMDAYWISLSRPDHREVANKKDASQQTMYKLVHVGDEVYSFLVRKTVHAIFETRKNGRTGVPYL